jgi:4-amino-4-deoxy-L-arabinose transferase-like glycosyltransferase
VSLASDEWELTAAPPREWGLALPLWPTAWAAILVAALWLRLGAIDAVPLAPDEAARALEARDIWRGTAGPYSAAPLLPNLLAIWFALFSAADGPARVPSALAGWALCLTPLLFRSRLGSGAALASTALLAFSPLGLLAARSAHPAALALLAGALAAGALLKGFERGDGRWLIASGVAVAAGLGATPVFVSQVVAVVIAWSLYPPLAERHRLDLRRWAPRAIIAGLVAALLLDTLLLTRPSGLQAGLIDPFTGWLSAIRLSAATFFSGALLGLHEVLLLALALLGLPVALRETLGRFLAAWALAGVALAVLSSPPDLAALAAPTVPLALLGGLGVVRLAGLRPRWRPAVWLTSLALLVPPAFLSLAIGSSVNRGAPMGAGPFAIAAGGLVAIVLLAGSWLELADVRAALLGAACVALMALSLTFLTRLNYAGYERGEPALLGQSSRPTLRQVEQRAYDWWRQDPTAPIRVEASLRPLLAWALRDGPPVEWISTAPPTADRAILGAETSASRPAASWIRLVVADRYAAPTEPISPQALWRWLVLRQSLVRPEPYAILTTL